jgi:hypothetical protein
MRERQLGPRLDLNRWLEAAVARLVVGVGADLVDGMAVHGGAGTRPRPSRRRHGPIDG